MAAPVSGVSNEIRRRVGYAVTVVIEGVASMKQSATRHRMTMKITEKDVGRVAVDRDGDEWTIVSFDERWPRFPVVARMAASGGVSTFQGTGRWCDDGSRQADLIRWADEPEAKPPPETMTICWDNNGWPSRLIKTDVQRPDLAGQSFTYRIEPTPDREGG